jgi:mono/diheme cytochrome c family protein
MKRLVCALAMVAVSAVLAAQAQTQRTSMDGIYSSAQASRGQALYVENCAACHGAELAGDPYAPPLTGPAFNAKWRDRPVGDLFEFMRATMPQTFPNSMSRQQNADMLAFIFQKNGLPAGKADLTTQADELSRMRYAPNPQTPVAVAAANPKAAPAPAPKPVNAVAGDGYYTEEQAGRGRVLFNTWCTACHNVGGSMAPGPTGRGFWLGKLHLSMNIGGRYVQKYPSVYHLFRRVRDSMPSYNADALSAATKVDIVAYLLQQSGLPAGRVDLPFDVEAMKSMRLAGTTGDPGFEWVFNGRDFQGLKFLLGPNCRPAPEGCGRTEPGTTFRVEHGEVVTNGKTQGYMYTEKKYLNFTLRFDFKHVPPADWDPEGDYFDGNSGYLLFITEHRVWPKAIEVQGNHLNPLHVIGMDSPVKATMADEAAAHRAKRPAGQWQSVEIVSKDGQVKSYLNGTLISTITEHEFKAPGHIGFQSEGAEVHWRNIRIKAD